MRLLVELDGQTVPLSDCLWVLRRPCGCAVGLLLGRCATSEDEALADFFSVKEEYEAKRNQGYRTELVTKARCDLEIKPQLASTWICSHGGTQ